MNILSFMMPDVSAVKPIQKFILFLAAFLFLILGLVNPQIGSKLEEVKREGSDIVICLEKINYWYRRFINTQVVIGN